MRNHAGCTLFCAWLLLLMVLESHSCCCCPFQFLLVMGKAIISILAEDFFGGISILIAK